MTKRRPLRQPVNCLAIVYADDVLLENSVGGRVANAGQSLSMYKVSFLPVRPLIIDNARSVRLLETSRLPLTSGAFCLTRAPFFPTAAMSNESSEETTAIPIYELRLDKGSQEVVDVSIGNPLILRCTDPSRMYSNNEFLFWLHQGQRLTERNGTLVTTSDDMKVSDLKILQADNSCGGMYECIAKSGQRTLMKAKLRVRIGQGTASSRRIEEDELCPPEMSDFCSNGGKCLLHKPTSTYLCRCPAEYVGRRCEYLESLVVSSKRHNEDCNNVVAERNRGIVVCSLLSCLLFLVIFCFVLYIRHRQAVKRPLKRDDTPGHVRSGACSSKRLIQLQALVPRTSSASSAWRMTAQERPKARLNACSD
uniref:EGF-like domain-containing protein n=1 Tax=Trichuris muris TaxID=70415 RepID=A0A5S6QXE0_TRIMR